MKNKKEQFEFYRKYIAFGNRADIEKDFSDNFNIKTNKIFYEDI
jgi:hypothetical protein